MTNLLKLLLPKTRKAAGCYMAIKRDNGNVSSKIKIYLIRLTSIKPRHIAIGAASITVALGTAASLGLTGIALSGAHNAAFSSNDSNQALKSKLSSEKINGFLPTEYNVSAIQAYWRKRPKEVMLRMTEVTLAFAPYIFKLFIWEYLIRKKIRYHEGLQRKYAVELREILTNLGPCFIKFGQALSIRPDILPSTFLLELQKLCDKVPPFPTIDAINVIENELGKGSVQKLFPDLHTETRPIAAASLGQVYKLRLKSENTKEGNYQAYDNNDRWVAVKVQRPDMIQTILKDLFILRILAGVVENLITTFTHQQPYNVALLDTFAAASLQEINYIKEAENQEIFRTKLMPLMGGRIYVPMVYHEFTSRKVIVTEWIEGEKLANSSPKIIERLTKVGIECFLNQLLVTGLFHADPHPGNLLVTKDEKLAIIDFGLCENIPLPDTKNLTIAIVHLMQQDVNGLILDAIKLGFLPNDVNIAGLLVDLQGLFDAAQVVEQIHTEPQSVSKGDRKFTSIVTRRKQFWAVSKDLNKIFFNYPFLVPDYFALMSRAMIVLEGIAVTGNPEFDIFSESYPFAFKIALKTFGVKFLSTIAKELVTSQLQNA